MNNKQKYIYWQKCHCKCEIFFLVLPFFCWRIDSIEGRFLIDESQQMVENHIFYVSKMQRYEQAEPKLITIRKRWSNSTYSRTNGQKHRRDPPSKLHKMEAISMWNLQKYQLNLEYFYSAMLWGDKSWKTLWCLPFLLWSSFFGPCFGVFDLFEKKSYFPIKAHSRKTSTTLLFCLGSSHINRSIDLNVCSYGIPKAFCRTSLKWHSRY